MAENNHPVAFALAGKRERESASSEPAFAVTAEKASRLDVQPGKAVLTRKHLTAPWNWEPRPGRMCRISGLGSRNSGEALPSQGQQEMCLAKNVKMHGLTLFPG